MSGAIVFLFGVIITAVLMFTMVFYVIMFSDLDSDYINPVDLCNKLNQFVLPEYIVHGVLTLLYLVNSFVMPVIINLPLIAYHIQKVRHREHMYDATEVFKKYSVYKREVVIKLGFYLLTFFYNMYRMVAAIVFSNSV